MTIRTLYYLPHADPTPFVGLYERVMPVNESIKKITPNDTILFGGGTDVNPALYGESLGSYSDYPDVRRDRFEQEVFNRFKGIASFLGVCRGSQFLCVMNGGKLIQHVTHHDDYHFITTNTGRTVRVTSTHHQMMLPAGNYVILAYPPENRSTCYLDGNNDPIELPGDWREPEIVFWPETRTLSIQGHPEYLKYTHPFPTLCRELVQKYLFI